MAQIDAAWVGVVGAAVGAGATLITSAGNYLFNRRKHARERLWDERRAAYSALTARVGRAGRYAALLHKAYSANAAFDENPRANELEEALWQPWNEAKDLFEEHFIILSPRIRAAFESLIAEVHHAPKPFEGPDEDRFLVLKLAFEGGRDRLTADATAEIC